MSDVFVFGSNKRGIHGAGAALYAKQHHGALQGYGIGRMGSSYAIPTKSSPYIPLRLEEIKKYVDDFIWYARENTHDTFQLTEIGCGLAGYTPEEIAPMFKQAPPNVNLPQRFKDVLQRN